MTVAFFSSEAFKRMYQKVNILLLFLLIVAPFLSARTLVFAVDNDGDNAYEYSYSDLEQMPESELEDICIKRGFQLVNDDVDPDTGEIYRLTKQDYIDAAQRCLNIEKEMNDLLIQYPELANEIEEEINRMEEENEEKQAKLDELEKQVHSNKAISDEHMVDDDTNNVGDNHDVETTSATPSLPTNPAFTRGMKKNHGAGDTNEGEEVAAFMAENDDVPDKDDSLIIEEDDYATTIDEPYNLSVDDNIDSVDKYGNDANTTIGFSSPAAAATAATKDSDATMLSNDNFFDNEEDNHKDNIGMGMESQHRDNIASNKKMEEDFTLTHIAIESLRIMIKNAKDDVKRAIEMVVPVFQPLINAGDVAWKKIKVLYHKARESYRAYQASSTNSNTD